MYSATEFNNIAVKMITQLNQNLKQFQQKRNIVNFKKFGFIRLYYYLNVFLLSHQ